MSEVWPWTHLIRWSSDFKDPTPLSLVPDLKVRETLAQSLALDRLVKLEARLVLSRWRDGIEITGRLAAVVIQTCGVSLEPIETNLDETFRLRALPVGSPNLPPPTHGDVDITFEDEDPPEAHGPDGVDVGAFLCETLALSLDPFPRRQGVAFELPQSLTDVSPFSVLLKNQRADYDKG